MPEPSYAYSVLPQSGDLYVTESDALRLQARGYVALPDYVRVSGIPVVEIDPVTRSTRLCGLVTKASNVRYVARSARSPKVLKNKSYRLQDLMTIRQVATRVERSVQAINRWWRTQDSFPAPLRYVGQVPEWYWPDIAKWMISKNYPRRNPKHHKSWAWRKNQEPPEI